MIKYLLFIFLLISCTHFGQHSKRQKLKKNLHLKGKLTLSDAFKYHKKKGVLFIARDEYCPISKKQTIDISKIRKEAEKLNFTVFEVYLSDVTNKLLISDGAIVDRSGELQSELKFSTTTESILVNNEYEVVYRGAINDKFSLAGNLPEEGQLYLSNALNDTAAGKYPKLFITKAYGCELELPVKRVVKTKWTYEKDVKNLFSKKCMICHFDKQSSIPLGNYKEVKQRVAMIRYVVDNNIMPPWYADSNHRKYKNNYELSKSEKTNLLNWIDAGSPEGEKSLAGGKSDLKRKNANFNYSIDMPSIPDLVADRKPIFYDLKLELNNEEGFWVSAYDLNLSDPEAMHHVTMYVDQIHEKGFFKEKLQFLSQYLYISTGISNNRFHYIPEGHAFYVPKKAKLFFSVHIEPTGRPLIKPKVSINLKKLDRPPMYKLLTSYHYKVGFEIPANSKKTLRHFWRVPEDLELISVSPHMHLTGEKSKIYYKNGETIYRDLDFFYKFNNTYYFEEIEKIRKNETLVLENYFDNTKGNPWNPKPNQIKVEGLFSTNEMAMFVLQYRKKLY